MVSRQEFEGGGGGGDKALISNALACLTLNFNKRMN